MNSKALPYSVCVFILVLLSVVGQTAEGSSENASNPLAKVKNTDLRWQYFDTGSGRINDVFVEGAFMTMPYPQLRNCNLANTLVRNSAPLPICSSASAQIDLMTGASVLAFALNTDFRSGTNGARS